MKKKKTKYKITVERKNGKDIYIRNDYINAIEILNMNKNIFPNSKIEMEEIEE